MMLHVSNPIYPKLSLSGSLIVCSGSYGISNIDHSDSKSKLMRPSNAPKKPNATGGYCILTPSSMAMNPRNASEFKNEFKNT